MKITMYELITLMKNKKAPKKIKINEDILNLEIGKETLYRFEKGYGSLSFDYYIDNNKLDNKIEILDKDFKLEEEKKIPEKLDEYADVSGDLAYEWNFAEKKLKDKVNEIIDYLDYLKSKGE
jgi:hypothetical protein